MELKIVPLLLFLVSVVTAYEELHLVGDALINEPVTLECRPSQNSMNFVTFTDYNGDVAGTCLRNSGCVSARYNMSSDFDRQIFTLEIPACNKSVEGNWTCTQTANSKPLGLGCTDPPSSVSVTKSDDTVTCTSASSNQPVTFHISERQELVESHDLNGTIVPGTCSSNYAAYTASFKIKPLPGETVIVHCCAKAQGITEDKNIPCSKIELTFPELIKATQGPAFVGLIFLLPDAIFTAALYFKYPDSVFRDVNMEKTKWVTVFSCLAVGFLTVLVLGCIPLEQATSFTLGFLLGLVFAGISCALKLWCWWHSKKSKAENKETELRLTDEDSTDGLKDALKEDSKDPETEHPSEEETHLSIGIKSESNSHSYEDNLILKRTSSFMPKN